MVGIGGLMLLLTLYGVFLMLTCRNDKLVLRGLPFAILLPYIANTCGWLLTEIGRWPWLVFGLFKIEQGVSQVVSANMLWLSILIYVVIYTILIGANDLPDAKKSPSLTAGDGQRRYFGSGDNSRLHFLENGGHKTGDTTMILNTVWFILIVLYVVFFRSGSSDFGVSMLLLPGKDDTERRDHQHASARTGMGTRFRLITAGGATFAAFPTGTRPCSAVATFRSCCCWQPSILRWRSNSAAPDEDPKWRRFWDGMITIGGFLPALLLGVALRTSSRAYPLIRICNTPGLTC